MKEQFQHQLTTAFSMWFDNFLLTKGEAYTNTTGDFFHYTDNRLDSRYQAYGSPYKQWVTDSSVSGATIASGVYIGGNFSGRDDGVVLDFDNGRALISGSNTDLDVTGEFAVKDFNVYLTNDTEDDLIIENKYIVNSRLPSGPWNYIEPYDDVVPAIFLSTDVSENKPFAFGGMEDTVVHAKAVVLADDTYQLDGVLSIFMDSVNESIPRIPMSGYPITELGDLKGGSYYYTGVENAYSSGTEFFVDKVRTSKLSDRTRNVLANELYVGFIDFDIQLFRYRFQ
tara:strand:- start:589 stop:1437 length:849 start_codon:yes stop_codon:yes gene_type:complete